MNLQLASPYKTCPFKCSFCCAAVDRDYPWKDNLYFTDKTEYFQNLIHAIKSNNIKTVVITGDTEPTLFEEWMEECIKIIRAFFPKITIELQTKNYNTKVFNLDKIRYSIANQDDFYKMLKNKKYTNEKIGITYLYSASLNWIDIIAILTNVYNTEMQHTIKILQPSSTGNIDIDNWIKNNSIPLSSISKELFKSLNVWIDENCMDTDGRYIIFRIDGKIYKDWAELPI